MDLYSWDSTRLGILGHTIAFSSCNGAASDPNTIDPSFLRSMRPCSSSTRGPNVLLATISLYAGESVSYTDHAILSTSIAAPPNAPSTRRAWLLPEAIEPVIPTEYRQPLTELAKRLALLSRLRPGILNTKPIEIKLWPRVCLYRDESSRNLQGAAHCAEHRAIRLPLSLDCSIAGFAGTLFCRNAQPGPKPFCR